MKPNIKPKALFTALLAGVLLISGCSGSYSNPDTLIISPEQINYSEIPSTDAGNGGEVTLNTGDLYAEIIIKGYQPMKLKLFHDAAPVGVENFVKLATSGYYSGKTMHRIIADFMIQGGSLNGDGMSSPDEEGFSVEYCKEMRHFYGALCYANAGGINGTQFYIVNSKKSDNCDTATAESNKQYYLDSAEQLKQFAAATDNADEKAYYEAYAKQMEAGAASMEKNIAALGELTDEMKAKYAEVGGTSFLDGSYTVFGQMVEGFDQLDKISAVEVTENSSGEMSSPVEKVVIESVKIYIRK